MNQVLSSLEQATLSYVLELHATGPIKMQIINYTIDLVNIRELQMGNTTLLKIQLPCCGNSS